MTPLTERMKKRGFWMEAKATIPTLIWPDGQLVGFSRKEAEAAMDAKYPYAVEPDRKVWWFNATKDRECAETDHMNFGEEMIVANPSVMYELFWRTNHATV